MTAKFYSSVALLAALLLGLAAPPAAQAQGSVVVPDASKTLLLVRNALLTLNDAVQTGNFTVLRDKAAPAFQQANTAARLSQIFSQLTRQRVDLAVVSILVPRLKRAPLLESTGMLHITGEFISPPRKYVFDLVFQPVRGVWRLYGISLKPGQVKPKAVAKPKAKSGRKLKKTTRKARGKTSASKKGREN